MITCADCVLMQYEAQVAASCLSSRKEKILGVAFHPASSSTMVLYGEGFFCFVDVDKDPTPRAAPDAASSQDDAQKRRKRRRAGDGDAFALVTKFKPLMLLEFAGPSELVLVERPWLAISQSFPEPLRRHRYRAPYHLVPPGPASPVQ
jgi:hypothetical protein